MTVEISCSTSNDMIKFGNRLKKTRVYIYMTVDVVFHMHHTSNIPFSHASEFLISQLSINDSTFPLTSSPSSYSFRYHLRHDHFILPNFFHHRRKPPTQLPFSARQSTHQKRQNLNRRPRTPKHGGQIATNAKIQVRQTLAHCPWIRGRHPTFSISFTRQG